MEERKRTLAFQVPESLFRRVKDYLKQNNMKQNRFVIGLIESGLEQDEAQYQASRPEEQEDEEESDDQIENEAEEETQDEFAPQETQVSCPPMVTLPSVAARQPVMMFMVVDFPAPLGPRNP